MKKTFIFLSAFIIINCTYANTFIDIYADYPTVQANNIIFYFVQPGQISIGWTKGNGSSKIVFVSQGDTGIARPIDGTTYFADHQFGNGSQIGASGWYCIHKSPNSISSYYRDTITGLKPNTIYRVMVLEYNGGEGEEKYLRSTAQDNPMSQSTQPGIAGFIEDRYLDNVRSSCFSYIRNIISDGGKPIISHGLCWAAHHEPALADNIHINGTDVGAFKSCIGYLEPNTTYYVRSFLIYPDDTVYGNEFSIHTKSVKASITSAYDQLMPNIYNYGWGADPNNWVFGSITGGDANKGSDQSDQPDIIPVQKYEDEPDNFFVYNKWMAMYEGVLRCNDAIVAVTDSFTIDNGMRDLKLAELHFLRAIYYFELIKVFGPYLPCINENNMLQDDPVPNDTEIWNQVENDFEIAINYLPEVSDYPGHVNIWAAKAFYAKLLLYENKFSDAKAVFDDVISNGITTSGVKYALLPCFDYNFNFLFNNSSESVFAQQAKIDGGNNMQANPGYSLAYPFGSGPGGCCGFFQPSQSLVNSFKVDDNGLPLFDPSHATFPFNNSDLSNDDGLNSTDFFVPDTITPVDPRLDWTVGRRGIPYLDWGINPGRNWIRDQAYGGPYLPMKNVYRKADYLAGRTGKVGGWAPGSTLNYNLMRFADVLLMAAECEVELGNLSAALNYVNQIRTRANSSHVMNGERNAANYQIGTYPNFPNQEYAREAVRFERKLELAMEGHRFFDLVRWGEDWASQELNYGYLIHESTHRWHFIGTMFEPCLKYLTIAQGVKLYLPDIKHIGDPEFRIKAFSLSGLPVNYSSSNPNIVKIKGDTLIIIGLGTATVSASQSLKPGCLPESTDSKVIRILPEENIGIAAIEEGRIILYPNPSTGLITIITPDMNRQTIISVIDLSGRALYQQAIGTDFGGMINLDMSFLQSATYFIILKSNDQIFRTLFIKE